MNNSDKVSIVIVNYNGLNFNSECINSILSSSYKNIEIIIVDNASSDGSVDVLKKEFKNEIVLIEANENLGFSGANNIGIEEAKRRNSQYVMLINNDTTINKAMIEIMVNSSKETGNSIISPKIYYYDNKDIIWSAGADMRWSKGVSDQRGINCKDEGQYNTREKIEFATGCCLLIPIKIIQDLGGLSDEYFLYYEDTDYCTNVVRNGYEIYYEPQAIMYHKVSASTGGELSENYIYYNTRNRLIFNNKFNRKNKIKYLPYFYFTRICKSIVWIIKGRNDLVKATIQGIRDYKNNIYGKRC